MFTAERVFSIADEKTSQYKWYFQAREGNSGPYESKQEAQLMLQAFIKENIDSGNAGGRNLKEGQLSSNTQVTFKFRPKNIWY